jgi:hypothetical protein
MLSTAFFGNQSKNHRFKVSHENMQELANISDKYIIDALRKDIIGCQFLSELANKDFFVEGAADVRKLAICCASFFRGVGALLSKG